MSIDMAIGIPQPSCRWGGNDPITMQPAARTAADDTEEAGFYWVDPDHGSATDTANVYGYPDKPRVTFPPTTAGSPLAAGSVVQMRGNIDNINQSSIFCAGDEDDHVFITCIDPLDMPRMVTEYIIKGSYVTIEYLDWSQDDGGDGDAYPIQIRQHSSSYAHHICVRHCYGRGRGIDTGNSSCVGLYSGAGESRFHDIVFYDNDVADFGDYQPTNNQENDFHCFTPGIYVDYVWIINNTVRRMGGDAVQVGDAQGLENNTDRPTYVFIGNNTFTHNGENAIDIKRCQYVMCSENDLGYANAETGVDNQGITVVIHDDCEDIWFLNNTLHDSEAGFVCSNCVVLRILGNLIYNMTRRPSEAIDLTSGWTNAGVALATSGCTDVGFVNNTVFNYGRAVEMRGGVLNYQNNILTGRTEALEVDMYYVNSGDVTASTFDNNIIYDAAKTLYIRSGSGSTLGAFDTDFTGMGGSNNLATDPKVIETPGFTLGTIDTGGAGIDTGSTAMAAYITEWDAVLTAGTWDVTPGTNASITGDLYWNTLVQNSTKDIGAMESGGSTILRRPPQPKNVLVDVIAGTLTWTVSNDVATSYEVFKDNVSEGTVGASTYLKAVTNISSTANVYRVEAINAQDTNVSRDITSDVITVTAEAGDIDEAFPTSTYTYFHNRTWAYDEVDVVVATPTYTGTPYSIECTKNDFTLSAVKVGSGYIYVEGTLDNQIAGTITGTGTVEFFIVDNNRSDTLNHTSEFKIGSSVVLVSNTGAFQQNRISVAFTSSTSYTYTSTLDNVESAIGLCAIVQTA